MEGLEGPWIDALQVRTLGKPGRRGVRTAAADVLPLLPTAAMIAKTYSSRF